MKLKTKTHSIKGNLHEKLSKKLHAKSISILVGSEKQENSSLIFSYYDSFKIYIYTTS